VSAVAGGIGAAVCWAGATLAASRASRLVGAFSAAAWAMTIGLLIVAPVVIAQGRPAALDGAAAGWLLVSGAGNVGGLALIYAALRVGRAGLVSAIVATEGTLAALISVAFGERLGTSLALAVAVVVLGVAITTIPNLRGAPVDDAHVRSVALAASAALVFSVSLYATGRVSSLPSMWVVLPARLIGVLALALPLVLVGRLRISRSAAPLLLVSGIGEVLGFLSFTLGSRDSIAVTAVISSQGTALVGIGAYFLFRERLTRRQIIGIIVTLIGVGLTGAISASG
jgi:drug/metabolite transporter (DMT)-like permease